MTLSEYLDKHKADGVSEATLAAAVGVDRSQINRLKRGVGRPSWDLLVRIKEATGDAVTPNDFLTAPPSEPQPQAAE